MLSPHSLGLLVLLIRGIGRQELLDERLPSPGAPHHALISRSDAQEALPVRHTTRPHQRDDQDVCASNGRLVVATLTGVEGRRAESGLEVALSAPRYGPFTFVDPVGVLVAIVGVAAVVGVVGGPLDVVVAPAAEHALHTRHTKVSAAPMIAAMRAAGGWIGSMRVCLSLFKT